MYIKGVLQIERTTNSSLMIPENKSFIHNSEPILSSQMVHVIGSAPGEPIHPEVRKFCSSGPKWNITLTVSFGLIVVWYCFSKMPID